MLVIIYLDTCLNYYFLQKSEYVELQPKTVVSLLHVLTQDLEPLPVPVTKDILEMEEPVKVTITHQFINSGFNY